MIRHLTPSLADPIASGTVIDEQCRMVHLLKALAPKEGYNLTALPDVRLLRSNRPLTRTPVLYDPGIVIVCQGTKRGFFGDRIYQYDAQHYLAVAVPVPFSMETDATQAHPLLAIYMHLNFQLAAELILQIDAHNMPLYQVAPQPMMSSPMDASLRAAVLRFLEAMAPPRDAAILGPMLVREIYYRVFTGSQGNAMRGALAMRGQFGKIGRALERIHARYAEPLNLTMLCDEAGMSMPTFHSHFKAITHTSPMQYVKSIRLHQARLLMVRQDMTAEAASHAVGYASPSQFNREFKRLFGATPASETRRMRTTFALPPAFADAKFVSSH